MRPLQSIENAKSNIIQQPLRPALEALLPALLLPQAGMYSCIHNTQIQPTNRTTPVSFRGAVSSYLLLLSVSSLDPLSLHMPGALRVVFPFPFTTEHVSGSLMEDTNKVARVIVEPF